jgi:hypothetical protein
LIAAVRTSAKYHGHAQNQACAGCDPFFQNVLLLGLSL